MVWYSFSWSPKVIVTPLSETVFDAAADAADAVTPTARPARSAVAANRRQGTVGRRFGRVGWCCIWDRVLSAAAGRPV